MHGHYGRCISKKVEITCIERIIQTAFNHDLSLHVQKMYMISQLNALI